MSTATLRQTFAIVSSIEQTCRKCGVGVKRGEWYGLVEKQVCCAKCNRWPRLVFVPSGDPALTRRVSRLCKEALPVCEWNRRRNRWERRGTLATASALAEAEATCALDAEKREQARKRAQKRAVAQDMNYRAAFAQKLRELYSGLPEGVEQEIAGHACEKHSGRVGRTAAAKELSSEMLTLAVVAHIRHKHTNYDDLLMQGVSKANARQRIRSRMQQVLQQWLLPLTCADTNPEENGFD